MAAPKLNLVVAACNNGGIGFEGRIPWWIKQDMAFFKRITSTTSDKNKQNAVIMGRKTWFSIPEKLRPLPGRINVVLSKEMERTPKGAHLARSFQDALNIVMSDPFASKIESIFVIGGSSVYQEAMYGDYPCRLYLTRVLAKFECDTFLPEIDDEKFHKVPNPEDIPADTLCENDIEFKFEVYEKD